MAVGVNFGTVTNLLANFLWDILHNDPGDGVTNLFGDLDAMFFGNFLLDIYWILSTDGFRKLFTLFSRNIDWEILTSFIRDFFTFCSRNCFLNFLWNLFAVLFWYLEIQRHFKPIPHCNPIFGYQTKFNYVQIYACI